MIHSRNPVTRREAMRLSGFATGPATLWLVLRDSRGGIAAQVVRVEVAP